MDWFQANWILISSLALSAAGVWWLLPSSWPRSNMLGVILALAGCAMLASPLNLRAEPLSESVLFWIFASVALVTAVLMITSRNPVYAALWFALATLSTCGLFLLQSAPFLAAATIVVYAGAIVVTFLFVIMLAQQSGATVYDQRARQPLAATCIAFVLLGALLFTLQKWDTQVSAGVTMNTTATTANPLSRPAADQPIDTMHALGRSLFGDYLFAVELAGTVLLVAAIGAIAMAPRRAEGTL